jgi:RNA-dependent RNA polymerase
LPNCVIFPKKGDIPLTSQISGSDLDGDTFFIAWDERLIPKKSLPPFIYDDQNKN